MKERFGGKQDKIPKKESVGFKSGVQPEEVPVDPHKELLRAIAEIEKLGATEKSKPRLSQNYDRKETPEERAARKRRFKEED